MSRFELYNKYKESLEILIGEKTLYLCIYNEEGSSAVEFSKQDFLRFLIHITQESKT